MATILMSTRAVLLAGLLAACERPTPTAAPPSAMPSPTPSPSPFPDADAVTIPDAVPIA